MLALVDPDGNIVRTAQDDRVDLSAEVREGYRWLPVVAEATDTSTAGNPYVTVDPVVQTVEEDRVLRTRTRRDMTAAETTAAKNQIVESMDRLQFLWLFNHENRLRALESAVAMAAPAIAATNGITAKPQVTAAQALAVLRAML